MTFIKKILREPAYGWTDASGGLIEPSSTDILKEFMGRLNVFQDRRNWITTTSWMIVVLSLCLLAVHLIYFFSPFLLLIGFLYSMVWMGSYGTIWFHRYATHRSYAIRNGIWRWIIQNLAIKVVPEEVYVISHHVHHALSDQPGDPYNAKAGWLYCFLADANHQQISRDLSNSDYQKVAVYLSHTGIRINSFKEYLRWGSVSHPADTWIRFVVNWIFWSLIFYALGGFALVTCLFGWAGIWALGVRTFNYSGHGAGKDIRREGQDFCTSDLSVNQLWPGLVSGEWHNNHHLFPGSAKAGFKFWQLDIPWICIRLFSYMGGVTSFSDATEVFHEEYLTPYNQKKTTELAKSHGIK